MTIKNLEVEFPSDDGVFSAVSNISFDIAEGEIVGLVGESGSGKSVTALSLMQLTRFIPGHRQAGEILLHSDGVSFDLTNFRESQLKDVRGREISMIFQEPMSSLNPALSVGNQIAEGLRRHQKLRKADAMVQTIELLQQVGIDDPVTAFNKFPHQMSGGQKQRVLIASAIASKPRLLIADEPTTALDASVQKRIIDLLVKIQRERNMSVFFISHDLDLVSSFADRILVMYSGKIVESGTVKEIFSHPKHPYTKGLIACRPPDNKRYYFLPTINDFMRISKDGKHEAVTEAIDKVYEKLQVSDQDYDSRLKRIQAGKPVLQVQRLKKTFSKNSYSVRAVDEVSFELRRGETLGLVGESGCGKTTLARCLVRLETPDGGTIALKADPSDKANRFQRARSIQYIFQDPYSSLNPRLSIGAQLMEPLIIHKIGKSLDDRISRVNEMLVKVGLMPYHFNKLPSEFSGGQRQRICIARALLLEPQILICDESVSALDASVQAQVLNLLNELKYEFDLSFLFISHDLSVVRFMSDRIMVMNHGKIVDEGSPDHLFHHSKNQYTRELIEAIPGRSYDLAH